MSDQSKPSRIIVSFRVGIALAVANIACAAIIAFAWVHVRQREETVQVKGSAKVRIQSDLIVWRASVTAREPDLAAAYKGDTIRNPSTDTLGIASWRRNHQHESRVISIFAGQVMNQRLACLDKMFLVEEVARRIAEHRQLREENNVSRCLNCVLSSGANLLQIAREVTDGRVDLCKCDLCHGSCEDCRGGSVTGKRAFS